MARLGIETGADLKARSLDWLAVHFGSSALYYHNLARGICHRQVKADRAHKSVSAEDTFNSDIADPDTLLAELERIGRHVWDKRVEPKRLAGRTVNLKVKYSDFQIVTRARSLDRPVADVEEFVQLGQTLLRGLLPPVRAIRLLGLGLSGLSEGAAPPPRPLELPLAL
jgi:DNA polymerase-4